MPKLPRPRFYYGWAIVATTFAVQFVSVGLSYYVFSVFLKPLTEALDADRFYVSLAMSLQLLTMALLSPLAGRWFSHLPIKYLMLGGVASLSTGYIALSHITTIWQLYVVFGGFVGLGGVLLGVIPCNTLLANWFVAKRGTAVGISQSGISASGTVLVPAITYIILTYGWQSAFLVSGIGAAVILVPLIAWLVVRSPEEMGLHPDGAIEPAALEQINSQTDWTFKKVARHRDTLLLTLTIGPCYLGISSVILAMPSHVTDMGISAMNAAIVVSVTAFLAACAKPLFGIISDYISKKLATSVAIILQAAGVLLLLSAETYPMLLFAGVCFGLGYGAMSPLWGLMLAERFGRAAFAKVMGANQLLLMPFSMLGFPLTNYIFDKFGSYIPAFTSLLVLYLIALLALRLFRLEPNAEYD
ncbi:MAG: MFS family permease [Candidatus Azotimanducaceae bacterium]